MNQALRAAYQLSQAVELSPSSGGSVKFSLTVGLRGEYDCERCSESMKLERGGCPFVEDATKGTVPQVIGDTGDEAQDVLWVCPLGVTIRNPGLFETLKTFWQVKASGVYDFYGEGLVQLAPRVAMAFAEITKLEHQFEAQIYKTRSLMDRRGGGDA